MPVSYGDLNDFYDKNLHESWTFVQGDMEYKYWFFFY